MAKKQAKAKAKAKKNRKPRRLTEAVKTIKLLESALEEISEASSALYAAFLQLDDVKDAVADALNEAEGIIEALNERIRTLRKY